MNRDRLSAHLSVGRYGDFQLTGAVRPGPGVPVLPREGYRVGVFRDRDAGLRIPVLSAAVSADRLFDTFLALLRPLGAVVDVVLEGSHGSADNPAEFRRDHIDRPVLASHLCDFEDLLTEDGCTGVAVLAAGRPAEVQFDEHKLLHVYAPDLRPFHRVLRRAGLGRSPGLALISDAEHLHHTNPTHAEEFRSLAARIGAGDPDRVFSSDGW